METLSRQETNNNEEMTALDTQLWKIHVQRSKKQGKKNRVYSVNNAALQGNKKKFTPESFQINSKTNSLTNLNRTTTSKWQVTNTYDGEWKNDLRHGYGVETLANGVKYEGEWKYNKKSDYGVLWVPNSQKENKIANDEMQSVHVQSLLELQTKIQNEMIQSNSDNSVQSTSMRPREHQNTHLLKNNLRKMYQGYWKNDFRDVSYLMKKKKGKGIFYFKNGDRYEGEYRKNVRHGYGVMHYKNGDKYSGDWQFQKKTGFGRYTFAATNDIFEGYWLFDRKEGPGHYMYSKTNQLYVGEWCKDVPVCGYLINPNPTFLQNQIPELFLVEADDVLKKQIQSVRQERNAIRSLANSSIEALFERHSQTADMLNVVFLGIAVPLRKMHPTDLHFVRFYVLQSRLLQVIAEFGIGNTSTDILHSTLDNLGVKFGKPSQKTILKLKEKNCVVDQKTYTPTQSQQYLIMTLFDFAKFIFLLKKIRN
ncbi:hypothetical protein RFI_18089 [Reticulomyxa filosa]|uniref:MORN repeat-containing protein 3 n=1 Tax=Reticulomyxa filosa TaxID=46433 RepID=X6MZ92_RETFI|nr:hypothetical protein RFI_18089 [Reticulomyxa filosa]|eukprot:ETO19146.1 hypothetical protein RFI_18089 [Reticulomyxa filosa]